jgi:drug/metabolite transporter (DMT)-like permease
MGIDIRLPIGILFSIFGVMLTVFGVLGDSSIYAKSLNININFWWGIVMLLFGFVMLGLAYYGRDRISKEQGNESSAKAATH